MKKNVFNCFVVTLAMISIFQLVTFAESNINEITGNNYEDINWRLAYYNIIEDMSYGENEVGFIYLNDDDIPELVIGSSCSVDIYAEGITLSE